MHTLEMSSVMMAFVQTRRLMISGSYSQNGVSRNRSDLKGFGSRLFACSYLLVYS